MFHAAEALNAEIEALLPRAYAKKPNAAVHLEKAGDSVLFNMCEGIGIFSPNGKINAYAIARKEANEIRGVLRKLVIAKVFTHAEIQKAYNLAGSVIGMLTAAIISIEKRRDGSQETPPASARHSRRPRPP